MRPGTHETKEKLVAATVGLLDDLPSTEVNAARVLERTGISKGSMYHFFEDFGDLLIEAYSRRFAAGLRGDLEVIRSIVEQSTDADDFAGRMRALSVASQSQERASRRYERARVLAMAEHDQRLRQRLAGTQNELNALLAALVSMAQAKGWLNSSYTPRAAALLIQAYTLGSLINDVTDSPVPRDEWIDLLDLIFQRALR